MARTVSLGPPPVKAAQSPYFDLALQARLQAQDGLRVELGDARLGDAEDLADLSEGQVLVVVEGDHELLALGQARDRVREPVLQLADAELLAGSTAFGSFIVSSSETWSPLESDTVHSSSSATTVELEICIRLSWKSLDRHLELVRHLRVGGHAAELVLELGLRRPRSRAPWPAPSAAPSRASAARR